MKKSLIASFLAMGMWAGCFGGEEGESESGMTLSFVVNKVTVPAVTGSGNNKQVVGFNLDGIESGAGGSGDCQHAKPDYLSGPPDNIAGVDNQLQSQIGYINTLIGDKTLNQTLAEQINTGTFLLILDISSLEEDNIQNDDNVKINFYLGAIPDGKQIQLGTDGLLAADQTFVRSQKIASVPGSIENGRLITIVPELTINVNTANFQLPLIIQQAQLRTTVSLKNLSSGVVGGAVPVKETIQTVKGKITDPIVLGILDYVEGVLIGLADINPSTSDQTKCQSVSLGLAFGATTTTTP